MKGCTSMGLPVFKDSPVIPVKTGIHHSAHLSADRQAGLPHTKGASMTFAGVTIRLRRIGSQTHSFALLSYNM